MWTNVIVIVLNNFQASSHSSWTQLFDKKESNKHQFYIPINCTMFND